MSARSEKSTSLYTLNVRREPLPTSARHESVSGIRSSSSASTGQDSRNDSTWQSYQPHPSGVYSKLIVRVPAQNVSQGRAAPAYRSSNPSLPGLPTTSRCRADLLASRRFEPRANPLPYPVSDFAMRTVSTQNIVHPTFYGMQPQPEAWVTAHQYFALAAQFPTAVGQHHDPNTPISSAEINSRSQGIRRSRPVLKMRPKGDEHVSDPDLTEEQEKVFSDLCLETGDESKMIKRLHTEDGKSMLIISTTIAGGYGQLFIGIDDKKKLYAVKCIGDEIPNESVLLQQQSRINPNFKVFGYQDFIEMARTKKLAPKLHVGNLITPAEEPNYKYLPMRLMRGDGRMLVNNYKTIDDDIKLLFTRLLLRATAREASEIHKQNYLHSDLKLENILFDADGTIQIADFGFTRDLQSFSVKAAKGGTFFAPEAYATAESDELTDKVDVWSLAMSFLFANQNRTDGGVYDKQWPFVLGGFPDPLEQYKRDHRNGKILSEAIGPQSMAYGLNKNDPELAAFILDRMLHPEPKKRASMQEVVDFIDRLLFGNEIAGSSSDRDNFLQMQLSMFTNFEDKDSEIKLVRDALQKIQGEKPSSR